MNRPMRCTSSKVDPSAAATTIQAGFRGYRVRKLYHLEHDTEKLIHSDTQRVVQLDPESAATRIQASYRGYRIRHALHPQSHDEQLYHHRPALVRPRTEADTAAAKIQASFRGYMTRRALAQNRSPDLVRRYEPVSAQVDLTTPLRTRDQNFCPDIKQTKERNNTIARDRQANSSCGSCGAIVTQTGSGDFYTQKARHIGSSPTEHHAVSPTESGQRFESADKENAEQAATRIQATYRGFATRRKLKQSDTHDAIVIKQTLHEHDKDPVDPNEAATKIQAAFRGFSTRQRVHLPHSHLHQ